MTLEDLQVAAEFARDHNFRIGVNGMGVRVSKWYGSVEKCHVFSWTELRRCTINPLLVWMETELAR